MKYFLPYMLFLLTITACKKENTSTVMLNQNIDTTIAIAKDSGTFINGPYGQVMGKAKIYKAGSSYKVALENFSSTNGPDLKVYLSKEMQPVNFVNLGSLASVTGNQLYNIPVEVTVQDYMYVLIHCQQYDHLFGYALLRQ